MSMEKCRPTINPNKPAGIVPITINKQYLKSLYENNAIKYDLAKELTATEYKRLQRIVHRWIIKKRELDCILNKFSSFEKKSEMTEKEFKELPEFDGF